MGMQSHSHHISFLVFAVPSLSLFLPHRCFRLSLPDILKQSGVCFLAAHLLRLAGALSGLMRALLSSSLLFGVGQPAECRHASHWAVTRCWHCDEKDDEGWGWHDFKYVHWMSCPSALLSVRVGGVCCKGYLYNCIMSCMESQRQPRTRQFIKQIKVLSLCQDLSACRVCSSRLQIRKPVLWLWACGKKNIYISC